VFDLTKFIGWVRDGLFQPHPTWTAYKAENFSWKDTALQLSLPLMIISGLLVLVLGWLFADSYLFGGGGGFGGFIAYLLMGLIWFGVGGFIASFLAGKFGGKDSFAQAFSALSFAAIPGMLGSVLGALPFIGFLLSLAGAIWSVVLLWQALPVFLDVPEDRKVGHFFATLGLSIVAMLVTGSLLAAIGLTAAVSSLGTDDTIDRRASTPSSRSQAPSSNRYSGDQNSARTGASGSNSSAIPPTRTSSDNGAGLFGFGREMDYLEAAEADRFTPPADGELDEEQVTRTVHFLEAAGRLRDAAASNLEKLNDENAEPSLNDLFKGVKGLVGAGTAEMQAVKSGGGNWAEHQWIKNQLFEANIHRDLNNTTEHNYELYQKYELTLKDWL